MLQFKLSWNCSDLFGRDSLINDYDYRWPNFVSIEFFRGIHLFLKCANFPAQVAVLGNKRSKKKFQEENVWKSLKKHILAETKMYEKEFLFDEFLGSDSDSERKNDRFKLNVASFCNKYMQKNIHKYCYQDVRMRYVADIYGLVNVQSMNYKKIQFYSKDFLQGILVLNEFTDNNYKVEVRQVYDNFFLCQLTTFHPYLIYTSKSVKDQILAVLHFFYTALVDIMISFLPVCSNGCYCHFTCGNLDHLGDQCCVCAERKLIREKKQLFLDLTLSSFVTKDLFYLSTKKVI